MAFGLALLAFPAAAQDTGVVDATVEVLDALPPDETCILLSAHDLDFGAVPLDAWARSESYEVVNCSEHDQDFLIRGQDATAVDAPATWTLGGDPHGYGEPLENTYFLSYWFAEPIDDGWFVTQTNALARPDVAAAAELTVDHVLYTPTATSDGAGETMHFKIIWTAMLSD